MIHDCNKEGATVAIKDTIYKLECISAMNMQSLDLNGAERDLLQTACLRVIAFAAGYDHYDRC